MTTSKKISIALVQALGLTLYISLFAIGIYFAGKWNLPDPEPPIGVMFFLLVFVFSALISASTMLGYPIWLFANGKKKEAIQIVIYSAAWIMLFLIIIALTLL